MIGGTVTIDNSSLDPLWEVLSQSLIDQRNEAEFMTLGDMTSLPRTLRRWIRHPYEWAHTANVSGTLLRDDEYVAWLCCRVGT